MGCPSGRTAQAGGGETRQSTGRRRWPSQTAARWTGHQGSLTRPGPRQPGRAATRRTPRLAGRQRRSRRATRLSAGRLQKSATGHRHEGAGKAIREHAALVSGFQKDLPAASRFHVDHPGGMEVTHPGRSHRGSNISVSRKHDPADLSISSRPEPHHRRSNHTKDHGRRAITESGQGIDGPASVASGRIFQSSRWPYCQRRPDSQVRSTVVWHSRLRPETRRVHTLRHAGSGRNLRRLRGRAGPLRLYAARPVAVWHRV